MIIHNMGQGSDLWWEARRGMPTASGFDRIISGPKKHNGIEPYSFKPKGSAGYIAELVEQHATLNPNYFTEKANISRSRETQYGQDTEPEAIAWLSMQIEKPIHKVGFITTDDEYLGCSPDGMVEGNEAGAEIKCPQLKKQVEYLERPNEVPKEYMAQVHGSMVVTGLKTWHFLSYAPGLDKVHVVVERNFYTERLAEVLKEFLAVYHAKLRQLCPSWSIVDEWRKWLRNDPPLDEFNGHLPEMAKHEYETKEKVWKLVQAHAARAGLKFDPAAKRYFRPVEEEVYF